MKKTPKELFISKVYSAITEFEETTGVEVHNIGIERLDVTEPNKAVSETTIIGWKFKLR